MIQIVEKACREAGGVSALAEALGIKRQAFYQWPQVPPLRVLQIEQATGGKVTRHEMRPDLYPPSRENAA